MGLSSFSSGLIGIDIDNLPAEEPRRLMHKALDDEHIFAAYQTVSAIGLRFIFHTHDLQQVGFSAASNSEVWSLLYSVARDHVVDFYGVKPDPQAKDLARASFVTYDSKLLINGQQNPSNSHRV